MNNGFKFSHRSTLTILSFLLFMENKTMEIVFAMHTRTLLLIESFIDFHEEQNEKVARTFGFLMRISNIHLVHLNKLTCVSAATTKQFYKCQTYISFFLSYVQASINCNIMNVYNRLKRALIYSHPIYLDVVVDNFPFFYFVRAIL